MHIGEFHESASRDASVRREAAVTELRQLADRLSAAPGNATPPATSLADSVRISPEARAAMNSLAPGGGPVSGSPAQVIAALRAILSATTPQATTAAIARLAELVNHIARTFPARATGTFTGYPIDQRAADLVRSLLPAQPSQALNPPHALAAVVRSLFPTTASTPTEASLQRAALAIFLATARIAHGDHPDLAPPLPSQLPAQPTPELPPALHSHLVQPPARRPRRHPRSEEDESEEPQKPGEHSHRERP